MKQLFLIMVILLSLSLQSMDDSTISVQDHANILCEVVCKKQVDLLDYRSVSALMVTNKAINKALATYQVDHRLEMLTDALQQSFSGKNLYWCPIQFARHPLGTALGWVDEICKTCLRNGPCTCRNSWGEKTTYPGVLCRAQFNKDQEIEIYKALVASEHANQAIEIHKQQSQQSRYPTIFPKTTQPQIHIPNNPGGQCHPHPYFDDKGNLCLLEGFGSSEHYPQKNDENNASYFCYEVDNARERSLSGSNTYASRKAYCELYNERYPLGLLYLFPLFFSKVIANQKTRRSFQNVAFELDREVVPLDTQEMLSRMLRSILKLKIKDRNDVHETRRIIYLISTDRERLSPSSIFLKAALCAKNGGNKNLACCYLKDYDNYCATKSAQQLYRPGYGWYDVIARPLGSIGTSTGVYNFREVEYQTILKKLTTEESIYELDEKIQNSSISVFKITNVSFIEVQQRIDYAKIYLWKDTYTYSDSKGRGEVEWKCSNKHKVVNITTGAVTNAYAYMDDTLEITAEQKSGGHKKQIKYRIEKDRALTDASRPIPLTQQLVQTLLLTRPLVWFRAFRRSDSLRGFIHDVTSRFTAFFHRT